MKFRNPAGTKTIEGRLPRPDEGFSEDRYYCDEIEKVFVRFDPYKDYIRVIFPCINEIELKIRIKDLEELAKKDVTILDLLKAAYNVEDVITKPAFDYIQFDEEFPYFIKFKKGLE